MHFSTIIFSTTALIASAAPSAVPSPAPLPSSVIDRAGAVLPEGGTQLNFSIFPYPSVLLQTQYQQHFTNTLDAFFQYGIDNIPKMGFQGYPRALIEFLKTWQAQSKVNKYLQDVVLSHFNTPEVPPCHFTPNHAIIGTTNDDTDSYLSVLAEVIGADLGHNLDQAAVVGAVSPANAQAAGSEAAHLARYNAYIDSIAGLNPAPQEFDSVLPTVIGIWQTLYYVVPGSCPSFPLDIPPFRPLSIDPSTAPLGPISPGSTIDQGTTLVFSFNSTVYHPSSPPSELAPATPHFAVFLNQDSPPSYVPLLNMTQKDDGNYIAPVKIPNTVVGVVYILLTKSDSAKTASDVVGDTVAGGFNVIVGRPTGTGN